MRQRTKEKERKRSGMRSHPQAVWVRLRHSENTVAAAEATTSFGIC